MVEVLTADPAALERVARGDTAWVGEQQNALAEAEKLANLIANQRAIAHQNTVRSNAMATY